MNETISFDDVLIQPNYCPFNSREDVSTVVDLGKGLILKLGVFSSNMDTITTAQMANKLGELGGMGILHRFMSIDDNICEYKKCQYPTAVSVGLNEGLERAKSLWELGARIICIDTAHGHSKRCGSMCKLLRQEFGTEAIIIAGNVCTYAGCDYLIGCGADIIKVGIGSGSVCSTRIKTGIGTPQLSAILECSRCSKPIISDGGLRYAGDICKAFVGGASAVMLGGMLSGCTETPGELISLNPEEAQQYLPTKPLTKQTYVFKKFRGMASKEAIEDYFGEMTEWKTAEGINTLVLHKGSVEEVVKDIVGGLRSCMTYVGAKTVSDLPRRAIFMRVTNAGRVEASPHILGH